MLSVADLVPGLAKPTASPRGDDYARTLFFERAHPSFIAFAERHGFDAYNLSRAMRKANWRTRELQAAVDYYGESWPAAMQRAIETERRNLDAFARLAAQRAIGPKSFRGLADGDLLTHVPQRLRSLVGSYAGDRGVLIVGPTGCGKSITAVALARRVAALRYVENGKAVGDVDAARAHARRGYQPPSREGEFFEATTRPPPPPPWNGVCWRSATALSMARREHPLGKGEAPAVEQAMVADLLVIDDLGWEPKQDTVCMDILAYRYDAGLPTIVTSGETPADLAARYSAAAIRRITETEGVKGVLANLFPKESGSPR